MSNETKDDAVETESDSANVNGNLSDYLSEKEIEALKAKERKRAVKDHKRANNIAGRTRFTATVPSTGLLIASVVLSIGTIVQLVISSYEYVIGEINLHELTIECVEYADAFLLAVALYIMSIGLVSLFVSEDIPLPKWLKFHDFDDLKERLTSVIIVMIGVFFLGYVLKGNHGIDTLWLGLGCAIMIIALSVFMRTVFKSDE